MHSDEFTARFSAAFGAMLKSYEHCTQLILRKYGLYPGQPQLLFAIRELGSPSQNELAAYLRVSKATVGVSLRRLSEAGFIKRSRDRHDTRRIKTVLTQRGEDFTRWCDIDYTMLFTTMLEALGPAQRESALETLSAMDGSLMGLYSRLSGRDQRSRVISPQ